MNVVVHTHPPKDEGFSAIPFRQFFTDTGLSTGDNDMRVATDTDFWVAANGTQDGRDTYIKSISFIIADAGASLNEFGNIGELTNGVNLIWITQDLGTITIAASLVSNWDFVRLAGGQPAYGTGNAAFKANNVVGSSEAFTPFVDLEYLFGLQYGVRLRAGTNDKLMIEIRDDTSGVDQFNGIVYGIKF